MNLNRVIEFPSYVIREEGIVKAINNFDMRGLKLRECGLKSQEQFTFG